MSVEREEILLKPPRVLTENDSINIHTNENQISKQQTIEQNNNHKNTLEKYISCDHSNLNRWKFSNYSNNFVDDELYLNNFDFFWIKNCEKDVYIIANEDEKFNKISNIKINQTLKKIDKDEIYPTVNKHRNELNKEDQNNPFYFSYDYLNYQNKQKLTLAVKYYDMNSYNSPLGLFVLEPVNKDFSKDLGYTIKLPPNIGPSLYKNFYKIRNVFSNTIICVE